MRPPRLLRPRAQAGLLAMVAALAMAGCDLTEDASEDQVLTIYVSAPERGPNGAAGRDIRDGARLALEQVGGEAAGRAVEAEYLDSTAGAGPAGWTQPRVARNARTATRDSTTIAYIGDFESGATRVSLPITNEAGILHVSPGSTAVDLARPSPGSSNLPRDLQASGERTFARVIPDDDAQGEAAAVWAAEMGAGTVTAISDASDFGDGLAGAFTLAAGQRDLRALPPAGQGGGDRSRPINRPEADVVFYAGLPGSRAFETLKTTLASGETLIASDALLPAPPGEGGAAELRGPSNPVYLTASAQPPALLPGSARDFLRSFQKAYDRRPGPYAAYGYEAMASILDALERANEPDDRTSVVGSYFATTNRESVLGTYSIDEVGNTTLGRIGGYLLDADGLRPELILETR